MKLWQRLLITVVAMFLASYAAGLIWQSLFGVNLPSYLGGIVGGLAAIPVWELLEHVKPRRQQ